MLVGDFTPDEKQKIRDAGNLMITALNSDEFEHWVLGYQWASYKYTGFWPFRKRQIQTANAGFASCSTMSRQGVYAKIMRGQEILDPNDDLEADIEIRVDPSNKRGVLGYTYPNTKAQWIYRWFLKSATIPEIAMNLAHEYMHKLGFVHDFNPTPNRDHSVPYAVGYFVRDFAKKFS